MTRSQPRFEFRAIRGLARSPTAFHSNVVRLPTHLTDGVGQARFDIAAMLAQPPLKHTLNVHFGRDKREPAALDERRLLARRPGSARFGKPVAADEIEV